MLPSYREPWFSVPDWDLNIGYPLNALYSTIHPRPEGWGLLEVLDKRLVVFVVVRWFILI
jgi:hypothetical protein